MLSSFCRMPRKAPRCSFSLDEPLMSSQPRRGRGEEAVAGDAGGDTAKLALSTEGRSFGALELQG